MITVVESSYRGYGCVEFNCPECGAHQYLSNYNICDKCLAPIPAVDALLEEVNSRMGFYAGLDPFEYS